MTVLEETRELLAEMKRCCDFYRRAIEIDLKTPNCTTGEEFEKKIDSILDKLSHKLRSDNKGLVCVVCDKVLTRSEAEVGNSCDVCWENHY